MDLLVLLTLFRSFLIAGEKQHAASVLFCSLPSLHAKKLSKTDPCCFFFFCGLFAALIARCQLRRGKLLLRLMPRHVLGASGCSGCSTEIFSGIRQRGKAQKTRQKQRRSFESLKSSSLCLSLPPAKESHGYILGRLSRNLNGSVFEGFFGRIEALKCLAVETKRT